MAETPENPDVIDGNTECLTLDDTLKHLARMMTALQHIRNTRKIPDKVLTILPDLHLMVKTLISDLMDAVKASDSNLKTLIVASDPNGLPAVREVNDTILLQEARRLRLQNFKLDEIAQRLGQPVTRISNLLQKAAATPPAQRMDATHNPNSVFNLTARLEEHQVRITTILSSYMNESAKDGGIPTAAMIGELTKLYKLSMDLQERVEAYNQKRVFKEALLTALDLVAPNFRDLVLDEMARIAKDGGDIL